MSASGDEPIYPGNSRPVGGAGPDGSMVPRYRGLVYPFQQCNIYPSVNRTAEQCSPDIECSRSCAGEIALVDAILPRAGDEYCGEELASRQTSSLPRSHSTQES